jgi:hypothetical protein
MSGWLLLPFLALIPARIAYKRGHSFWQYYIFGIALLIVAIPVAIFAAKDQEELNRRMEKNLLKTDSKNATSALPSSHQKPGAANIAAARFDPRLMTRTGQSISKPMHANVLGLTMKRRQKYKPRISRTSSNGSPCESGSTRRCPARTFRESCASPKYELLIRHKLRVLHQPATG